MTLALLALPLLLQSSGAPEPPRPLRQVSVEMSSEAGIKDLLIAGLDVIYQTPGTQTFELLCDDAELEALREMGLAYTVIHADTSAFYASRLAQESAAGTPSLGAWLSPPFGSGSIGGYYSWSEVVSVLDQIAAAYPTIVTPKASIGQSLEGRDLWVVKVSDNPSVDEAEPEVRFDSMHHAREPESMQALIWTLLFLTENYDGGDPRASWLVDNREMWFLPVVNPDGYVYNESTDPGGGGLWRKNRRDNGDGTFGVDLNRNYPFEWGFDNLGSSSITASETYRGAAPTSEPETAAMVAFLSSRSFVTALSCHTYSNLWIYPWGYFEGAPANDAAYDAISTHATAINQYTFGPAAIVLYAANGITVDYDHAVHGTLSWTPEIGGSSDGFWPPQSRIVPLAEENLEGFLRTAAAAGSYAYIVDEARAEVGDGDGFHEPGESVTVTYTARNGGVTDTSSAVVLSLLSTHPDLTVSGAGSHDFGVLSSFDQGTSAALTLDIALSVVPGTTVTYEAHLTADGGTEVVASSLLVGQPRPILTDDLEIDLGWTAGLVTDTATTGLWEYGDPVGTFSGLDPSNPEDDATPGIDNDNCFATGNGSGALGGDDVDDGLTTLITPRIDLSSVNTAVLRFSRWYANFSNADDALQISISDDDGASWVPLETVVGTQNEWTHVSFLVDDFVALTSEVRLRFIAEDDPNNSIVEAAVDDMLLETFDTGARFNVFGSPEIGTPVAFHVAGPPGGLYGVLQSEGTGFFSFPLIDGPLLLDVTTLMVLLDGTLPSDGLARDVVGIPNQPALVDVTLYFQGIVSGPDGLALSNRDEITFE